MIQSKFTICNVDFTFKIMNISSVFRINVNKLNKLVDFDNRIAIKLSKSKDHLKICNTSSSIKGVDIIPYLKSDYEFMTQVLRCIDIISRNYKPRSLDYSDITGDSPIVNDNPLSMNDVTIKWTSKIDDSIKGNLLITIF